MVGYNTTKPEYLKGINKVDLSEYQKEIDYETIFSMDDRYKQEVRKDKNPDSKSLEEFRNLLVGESEKQENILETDDYRRKINVFKEKYQSEEDVNHSKVGGPNYSFSVIRESMPSGLFGWTRIGAGKVHVNNNLYKKDERRTVKHEITHLLNPGKDELTIRYLNGDIDPEKTLSSNYI